MIGLAAISRLALGVSALLLPLQCGGEPNGTLSPVIESPGFVVVETVNVAPVLPAEREPAVPVAVEAAPKPVHTYAFDDAAAAHRVLADVADGRGWTYDDVLGNLPFLDAVMNRESHYCPNVRGGDVAGPNCEILSEGWNSGHHSDSGYGQVNRVHHEWLCAQEGICGPEQITASPENSMTALLALFEREGRQPWCYDAKSRASRVCRISAPGVQR